MRLSRHHSRAQAVYEYLRDAILSGDLRPNERLVEDQIAESASVSRTPVREAIRKLEVEGLVRQTRVGIIVVEITATELREFCQVREVLEGTACRLAAESGSQMDVAALVQVGAQYAAAVKDRKNDDIVKFSRAFHETVWRMANNRYLESELRDLRSRIDGLRPLAMDSTQARHQQALAEHKEILDAIRRRDADAAESVAKEHFRRAMSRRLGELLPP
jgi:DNA-binding GntR family transcriptional regulator